MAGRRDVKGEETPQSGGNRQVGCSNPRRRLTRWAGVELSEWGSARGLPSLGKAVCSPASLPPPPSLHGPDRGISAVSVAWPSLPLLLPVPQLPACSPCSPSRPQASPPGGRPELLCPGLLVPCLCSLLPPALGPQAHSLVSPAHWHPSCWFLDPTPHPRLQMCAKSSLSHEFCI